MRILLYAMPDSASCFDGILEIPHLGLASLAGNLDPGHEVHIVDLVKRRKAVARAVRETVEAFEPDLVGLTAMSFQYDTALRVAELVRALRPRCRIVLGGYHATLLYEEIGRSERARVVDFLVRGEGEAVFRDLVRTLEDGGDLGAVPGVSFRADGGLVHNPPAPLLDLATVALPRRDVRVYDGFHFLGRRFEMTESTRGCWMPCRFCSITRMYGTSFRRYPLGRVLEDLRRIRAMGTQGIFFADDNITLDTDRLVALCRAIAAEGLADVDYLTQASCVGIGKDPAVAEALREAGFRFVFLGIESGLEKNLRRLGKGDILEYTHRAVASLRRNGIIVFGGFIIANPDDTAEDIRATYRFARRLGVDFPIVQCLTPYPRTRLREELLAEGLVVNPDDLRRYNGFVCNVRTRHLSARAVDVRNVLEGVKLYWDPRWIARSRIWRYNPWLSWRLVRNNVVFVWTGLAGRLFLSTHRFGAPGPGLAERIALRSRARRPLSPGPALTAAPAGRTMAATREGRGPWLSSFMSRWRIGPARWRVSAGRSAMRASTSTRSTARRPRPARPFGSSRTIRPAPPRP